MRKSRNSSLSRISEQRPSIKVNYKDAEANRIARHQKLIHMIYQYSRTIDEEQKLRRMRKNTVMEIDIRFRNSKQNKTYIFPRDNSEDNEQEQEQESPRNFMRNVYYDLHSQNQLIRQPSQSQFLQISRRVKSLDQVSNGVRSQKFIKKLGKLQRLQTDLDNDHIQSASKRSKTITKQSSSNQLVLPVLGKKVQNLKTEGVQNNYINKMKVQKLVMKKLVTEAYNPIQQSPLRTFDRKAIFKRK